MPAMSNNQFQQFQHSLNSAAPLGAASAMGEEVSALQTLIDILSRSNDVGCEPCGGSGVKGRGLCERCRGKGSLLTTATPAFSRF
jgi:DnaJ-class molecular chaperone